MRVVAETYVPERIVPKSLFSPANTYSPHTVPTYMKTISVGDAPPIPVGKALKPKNSSATPRVPVHPEPNLLPTTSVSASSATVTSMLPRALPYSWCCWAILSADVASKIGLAATLRVPQYEVLSSCVAVRMIAYMNTFFDKSKAYMRTIIMTRSQNN